MSLEQVLYPHPHVDPRQPRDGAIVRVNPPVFTCKPTDGPKSGPYTLIVGRDPELTESILAVADVPEPVFLPEKALEPGTYYWRFDERGSTSKVFKFRIQEDAVRLEVPPAGEWLKSFATEHPRFLFSKRPDPAFLARLKKQDPESVKTLFDAAEMILEQSHHMDEPPYKGSRQLDYERFRRVQYKVMWESRKFTNGAQTMALAYKLGGKREFGEAAARRVTSVSKWDPFGSTHLAANDEPHMAVMWYGAAAADWAWDCFTAEEKSVVVSQMRDRAAITFEHMHDRGQYGVERFDSHAGREIVFLANLLFVFHDHIPEAESWLNWLRPVLCGIWPIWADDDGSWAEGISYSTAYVNVMSLFASALKRRTGVDLYRKPFWANYARWRAACQPPYAEWVGFGDQSERWPSGWLTNARLIELISREVGISEFDEYVRQLRNEVETMPPAPSERRLVPLHPPLLLGPEPRSKSIAEKRNRSEKGVLQTFSGAGWAAFRTDFEKAENDIALIFRCSPYGSVSHSHANNNDFILHAGGKALAIPSGYYAGYGSSHHAHWMWHTQSHNCVTLSGAPQLMRSPKSRGELLSPFEDENVAYVLGNADESYSDRATHCRRHVLFFKRERLFLMLDDFLPHPDVVSSFQWNLHSWAPFELSQSDRSFSLAREGCSLKGILMYHRDGFFSMSEGWDPPFQTGVQNSDQWRDQYNLRFTPTSLVSDLMHCVPEMRFGALLVPETPNCKSPEIEARIEDGVEIATFGGTRIEIPHPDKEVEGVGMARIRVGQTNYRLHRSGIETV